MDQFASMAMYVQVVEKGSFAAAAEATGISATMVGNHIRALERRLQVRLLNRTTRRQSLTEIGRVYYEQCVAILGQVKAAEVNARETRAQPRGQLRISAPTGFGAQKLIPVLNQYLDDYPDVEIDLGLSDRVVDLAGEGFDAAIRVGVLPDSGLIARPLAPAPRVICASPTYLARYGEPDTLDELTRHNCLDFSYPAGAMRSWRLPQPDGSAATVRVSGRLSIDSVHALRMAAIAGIGIVMQPEMLVADDIAAGRLKRLLPNHPMPTLPVHIVYLPDRQMTPKLTSFVEFAMKYFG